MATLIDTSGGCQTHTTAHQAKRVPVTVNGTEIPYAEIAREVQFHPAPTPVEAWTAAARALAVRVLLLAEASRLGLAPRPISDSDGNRETDDEALIRQVISKEVVVPAPTEADCKRYYDQNKTRFRTPAIAEASHILLAASPADGATFEVRRAKAERCIAMLSENPGAFAKLAREVSDCPSAAQGGNLGQLSSGQTTPVFEAALELMSPGDISAEPVESP
ncbi:MAG TPA: peptidylprolyl isomerase, partial [Hyphomicrobiaceae bacterium]|nr:peptidylprolyl isomerase [Hyphomicrobiaceae bacterium]